MMQTNRALTDVLLSDIAEIHTTNRLPELADCYGLSDRDFPDQLWRMAEKVVRPEP